MMHRFIVLLLLTVPLLSGWAAPGRTGENGGPEASKRGQAAGPSERLNFQTDLFTGRFGYSVPMDSAPGRHGSKPSLGLHYSSGGGNTWCGVGWDLDLGHIQRETRRGVPVVWTNGQPQKSYDDGKGFSFSLNGRGSALVRVAANKYRAEIEGGFLRFVLLTNVNQWQVTDTGGNKYFFGEAANSRMSNGKTGWPSTAWNGTFRWALSKVETVLGDVTQYTYTNISGALYPLKISYNGYTNGLSATHTVDFVLGNRTDIKLSYLSGYRVEQNKRLDALVHKVSGQTVWSNRLAYLPSANTTRSLLVSVTRFGTNLTSSLPATRFGYSTQLMGFQSPTYWTNLNIPTDGNPGYYKLSHFIGSAQVLDLLDMDGDGLPDRVFRPIYGPYTNLWVQRNNGRGFENPVSFGPLSVHTYWDSTVGTLTTSNNADFAGVNAASMRMLDLNGDSYPDRVMDPLESYSQVTGYRYTNFVAQMGAGTNFEGALVWGSIFSKVLLPNDPAETLFRAVERESKIAMIDINGDGLPDRLMARSYASPPSGGQFTNYWVQFNTGSGFTATNVWSFPVYDNPANPGTYGASLSSSFLRLLDLNGDGLPDRVMYPTNSTGTPQSDPTALTDYVVQFNNGCGFEPQVFWGGMYTWYNTPLNNWYPEGTNPSIQDHSERAYRDINGDGLPDRIFRYWQQGQTSDVSTNWVVQVNNGTNFSTAFLVYGPIQSQGFPNTYGAVESDVARLIDINSDGIPDHVMEHSSLGGVNSYAVELSKGPMGDLLTVVSNGIGGSLSVTYRPSSQYDNRESTNSVNSRKLLPFPVQTVASVSVSDGLYPSNTTTYAYQGGMWNPARREFHGFAKVTVVDPLGMTNVQWFHQSGGRDDSAVGEYEDASGHIAKKGMPFRVETIGTNGQLYRLVLNKVEDADLGSGRHFAYVGQTLTLDYPGYTNMYRATARQFAYDLGNGNLTNTVELGEVGSVVVSGQQFADTPGDTVYHLTTFASLSNTNILDKPERAVLALDAGGENVLRETLFDYDSSTGNLTRKRDRICPGSYLTTGFSYDAYANQRWSTNEAGVVTETTYDSTYQTFPVQSVTAGFTTSTQFDPRSGQLLSSTDAKGLITAQTYDAFLRLVTVQISTVPYGSATQWVERYDYRLGMNAGYSTNSVRVRRVDDADTDGHESWTYFDGLGRLLQTRVESETNNVFRISDTVYNKRGSALFESLPYFSSGSNYTRAATSLGSLREYDPVGRLSKATPSVTGTFSSGLLTGASPTAGDSGSPVGPVSLAYNDGADPWVFVTTDEANQVRKYAVDAYGRTNQIIEVTGQGDYNTYLRYTLAGDLTNITDHAGNQIEYAVNDLGQMVAMADPDMGVWEYRRDFAGRLREQVDARGNKVRFDYTDPLGRLHARQVYNPQGAFVSGVTNYYDTNLTDSAYTVYAGQLYMVTDSEGWEKFSYDVRGRTLKSVRYLAQNGQTYTNEAAFDNADRARVLTYPGGSFAVTNYFDKGGNLWQVRQQGGTNVFYTVRGFNALGQLAGATFGNGAYTTNAYYPNSKRLKQTVTRNNSSVLQSLGYTYDQVSNLKSIGDAAYTNTASASLTNLVYDDLHRLVSLTRPAISQTISFSYTPIGNMSMNGEAGAGSYNYGARMPHAVKSANGVSYAYDANGNMIVRGSQRLDYDLENRLKSVTTETSIVSLGYAADGSRLWKQSGTNLQVWIGANYEEKQGKLLFHVLAGGVVCTLDSTGTNVFEYYHADHLRSTSILTDKNGNRIQHHEYTAFGRDRFTESSTAFPASRRYTSQVLDEDTGLYYYSARYYDPQLGRFIQPDTIIPSFSNPQHLNPYSYCLNNPLRYTDPTGHAPEDDEDEIPLSYGQAHAASRQAQGGASAQLYNKAGVGMRATAAIGRAAAEMNPIVGGFNSGSQMITGKDAMDAHQLTTRERVWSGVDVGLQGSGKVLKAGTALGAAVVTAKMLEGVGDLNKVRRLGTLTRIGENAWESAAGLRYVGTDKAGLNRIEHVLAHLSPDASKAKHSVFSVARNQVLGLLDEAWKMRGSPVPKDPGAYIIPMGRQIGTAGETSVKIIVRPGTSQVLSAYPVK